MGNQHYPAIILAGGLGTRLRSVISDLPKPMAPVNDKPFLHYIFQYLQKQQINKAILSVGYRHEAILDYFGKYYLGVDIQYSVEEEPLGTGGGIKQAFNQVEGGAFVLNGDTFFDVDLAALKDFYFDTQSDLSLSLKRMQNFDRYGTVQLNDNRIVKFEEKRYLSEGLINGGVYFFEKKLFSQTETAQKFSFEKDVLEKYTGQLTFTGKLFDGYFIDIGIPEDYKNAADDFK